MDRKKIIVGILSFLILVVTGWLLLSVFKNLRQADKTQPPIKESKKEIIKTEKSDVLEGQVKKISGRSLTLQTESGEKAINIQEGKTKFYVKGEADAPVEIAASELQEGTAVTVIYEETKEEEILIASDVFQGTITEISGEQITLKSGDDTKTVTVTSQTTIYLTEGATDVTKTISDLQAGSLVTVIYGSEKGNLTALGIRIDKL